MKVEVRLFATFRNERFKKKSFEISSGITTPKEILADLGIKESSVAILLVNGIHSKINMPLKDGDIISLFPPVGGG